MYFLGLLRFLRCDELAKRFGLMVDKFSDLCPGFIYVVCQLDMELLGLLLEPQLLAVIRKEAGEILNISDHSDDVERTLRKIEQYMWDNDKVEAFGQFKEQP